MDEQTKVKVEGESRAKLEKNASQYKKAKSEKMNSVQIRTAKGDVKEKFIRSKTYANGVVKNSIAGLKKNGKFIFGTDK